MITRILIIGLIASAVIGILMISLVQTRIIKIHGIKYFRKRGFINSYWNDRTEQEKWIFFLGLAFVTIPFIIVFLIGIWQKISV